MFRIAQQKSENSCDYSMLLQLATSAWLFAIFIAHHFNKDMRKKIAKTCTYTVNIV